MAYPYDAQGIHVALQYESASGGETNMRMKFYTDSNGSPGTEASSIRKDPISTDDGGGGIGVGVNDENYGASLTVNSEGKTPAYSSTGNIGTTTADIDWIILEWNPTGDGYERLAAGKANSTITVADGQQITVQSGTTFYFEGLDPTGAGNDSLPPDSSPTSGNWENTAVLRSIDSMFAAITGDSITVGGNTWDEGLIRYKMASEPDQEHTFVSPNFEAGSPDRLDAPDLSGNPIELDSNFASSLDAIQWVIRGEDGGGSTVEAIVIEDPNPSIVDGDGNSETTIEGPAELYPDYFRSTV